MSGGRTSGTSRPSLGVQVLVVFPSFLSDNRSSKNVWEKSGSPRRPSSRHPRPFDFRGFYLVLQACMCISLCWVSDKNGAYLLLPCSHKECRCSYDVKF